MSFITSLPKLLKDEIKNYFLRLPLRARSTIHTYLRPSFWHNITVINFSISIFTIKVWTPITHYYYYVIISTTLLFSTYLWKKYAEGKWRKYEKIKQANNE
jgi:glucose-6-phosphate-specific signal transduction histidine kinase